MRRYILGRLFQGMLAIFGVSLIVFIGIRLSGDVTLQIMPFDSTDPEKDRQQLRKDLGLDKPLAFQYVQFVSGAVRGDFGQSPRWQAPAGELILERMPATLQLAGAAAVFTLLISVPMGILSAIRPGSWFDRFGKLLAMLGQSMPTFWLGLMMILFFAVTLHWFPSGGQGGFKHLIMPTIALGWYPVAAQMRLLRSALLDVLESDYIKMARIKGTPEPFIIVKHALKNAAIPVVTLMGVQWAYLLSGSVVTETVFSWPGVGRTIVEAVFARDYPVVQAGVFFISIAYVSVNLLIDLTYGVLDPRVRYR